MTLSQGIYTLANDLLYDQVIALVNSIRINYDNNIPICIIPYDDRISKLKTLDLDQVFLFNNEESLKKWGAFASDIWNHESFATLKKNAWYHGSNTIRKLCSFDGTFEQFVYIDSDALVMSSLEDCFKKLTDYDYDFVFDDWEHNKAELFLDFNLIKEKYKYSQEDTRKHCHCSDFFAGKSSLINDKILDDLKYSLLKDEEVCFINKRGWWDEVYLFSYITFRLNSKIFNYTLSTNPRERTGHLPGVNPFIEKDYVLFNKEGLKPIHRIHYMGYKAEDFRRLCQGEDRNIPYREVFLYYRFMNEKEKAPAYLKKVNLIVSFYRFLQKIFYKMKEKIR